LHLRVAGPPQPGEELSAAGVEGGKQITLTLGGLPAPEREGVERSDPHEWLRQRRGQGTRRRDPDAETGERTGTGADGDQPDFVPSPRRLRAALDRRQ